WLRQPTHRVRAHLASELGVDPPAPPPEAADPETTEILPQVPRHGPSEDSSPGSGRSLLLTGGNPGVTR
ncbi:MAG TPA: hypothetical protein VK887_02095, partial [Pseudonocardiaceae bacterium]|nr:hypothetical protein [Pseudonocardiaceae bacterium]